MSAVLGKQRTDHNGEWGNTLSNTGKQIEAAHSQWQGGTMPTVWGTTQLDIILGVAAGRMKGAEGKGSRLKHDMPSSMSRVCHSVLLKGYFKEARK